MPKKAETLDVTVTLPVYNEKEALRQCVIEVQEVMEALPYSYEILIVDDGSTDGSLETIEDLEVRKVLHKRNLGGAMARITGIRLAKGEIVVQSDTDATYPASAIGPMIEKLQDCDMVIGARKKESAPDKRLLRACVKWMIRKTAEFLSGKKIPDLNSGMRAYRKEPALRFAFLYPRGHSIMSTMTLAFLTNGLAVEFHEIDYFTRKGQSSFHPIRDTYNYLVTLVRTITYFNPLRVIMPLALFTAFMGICVGAYNVFEHGVLGRMPQMAFLASILLIAVGVLTDQFSKLSKQIIYLGETHWPDRYIEEITNRKRKSRGPRSKDPV